MKKLVSIIVFFVFTLTVSAQINVDSNGRVGIKTPSPTAELTVNGATTPNWGSAVYSTVSNENALSYTLYSNYHTSNAFFVHASGYIWCRLGGYFGSDINLKEDIKEIESPLAKVTQLHGVNYKYKTPTGKTDEKDKRMGLIAQEVEKVVPEVVKQMEDGTKAIAYTDLIGLLVEAVKEQQTQIEALKKQVESLTPNTKKE